jgi:hypothetical protein
MEAALVMPRSLDLLCRRRARQSAAPHPAMAAAAPLPRPMARASRRRIPLEITPQAFH